MARIDLQTLLLALLLASSSFSLAHQQQDNSNKHGLSRRDPHHRLIKNYKRDPQRGQFFGPDDRNDEEEREANKPWYSGSASWWTTSDAPWQTPFADQQQSSTSEEDYAPASSADPAEQDSFAAAPTEESQAPPPQPTPSDGFDSAFDEAPSSSQFAQEQQEPEASSFQGALSSCLC